MNLTKLFTLRIHTEKFDDVAKKPELINRLRSLTLHPGSGMNYELNHMLQSAKTRSVNAKCLLAYYNRELVGWALLSREQSNFIFTHSWSGYNPNQGTLLQVFVNPDLRRKGIGSALVKAARKKAGPSQLCVCPWDNRSKKFYQNFEHYKHIKL